MPPALADALTRLAGAGSIRHGTDAAGDAETRVAGVPALAVVSPPGVEEMAAVLAFCAAEGIPVEAAGAGTWLGRGQRPGRPPLVLSTARLTGIFEHEPADLVVGVRAGTPLAQLEARLREHGQTLPLDPPGRPEATIGAVIGLGSAGPLRAGHGTPRDLLLGVDVVTGDGRVLRFGGRVVKNVAGYDGVRLLTGSRGALGIVTGAFLLVRGEPELDRTVRMVVPDADTAGALALAVRDAVAPDALEVVLGGGSERWLLEIRLRGSPAAVHESEDRLRRLGAAQELGAGQAVVGEFSSGPGARSLAAAAVQGEAAVPGEAEAGFHAIITGPPASLALLLRSTERFATSLVGRAGDAPPPVIAAHGANGVVRLWTAAAPPAGSLSGPFAELRAELAGVSGTATCTVSPESVEGAPDEAGDGPAAGATHGPAGDPGARIIADRLRRAFDPSGIMMPGRDRTIE